MAARTEGSQAGSVGHTNQEGLEQRDAVAESDAVGGAHEPRGSGS